MTIQNFLKQLKASANRKATCEKRLKETYVPYTTKLAVCKNIVTSSSYRPTEDQIGEEYMSNTPARMMLFKMQLIKLYTDIEIDFNNIISCFDELEKEDAVNELLGVVPEREIERFYSLLDMVSSDFYENNRSLAGYLDHNSRALFNLLEGLIPKE